ncbi:MAG: S8 family serine peptidase [Sarcina sp.]
MFFKNKKISTTLLSFVKENYYESYRVLIEFKKFHKEFDKTISSLGGKVIFNFDHINLICADLPPRAINRIAEYPEVSYISLDEYCFLCGLSLANVNGVRGNTPFSLSGRGVKIALIDSGTFPHPDLTAPNKITYFKDLINDYKYPYDDNGHGTAISTLLCGNGISSKFKFKGIADKSSLISYKVFNQTGKANFSDILIALETLIADTEKFTIKLLCMPFESFNTPPRHIKYFDNLLSILISRGIIPIMPAGSNEATTSITGLANSSNVILVAGINNDLSCFRYSSKSNNNKKINICAKCSNISCGTTIPSYISQRATSKVYPPKLKEFYKSYSGTSIATAYICGVCALLLEKYPNYEFHDVASRIELCSEKIEDLNFRNVGNGILNLDLFLQ